jgi:RHS repeat-associated protein
MSCDAANRLTTSLLGTTRLTTFTYSNAGEMTVERCDNLGVWSTLVYDGEHRCLNELRASGAHHTYTYGSDGLRRSAHMGGSAYATSFIWDGTDLLNEYIYGSLDCRYDALEGELIAEKRGANRYVYGVDPLGSVVHLLNSSLNRAGTYVYWPYGEVQSHTGADTPMQYVGGPGYYTGTVNRLYVKARDLRPDLGRWVTEDPIGFQGRYGNAYEYADANPPTVADPTGLWGQRCHYGNTREWLQEAGICWAAAATIGEADAAEDNNPYFTPHGGPPPFCPDPKPGWSEKLQDAAIRFASHGNCSAALRLLGSALHYEQDTSAHCHWAHMPWDDEPCYSADGTCPKLDDAKERTRAVLGRMLSNASMAACFRQACKVQGPPPPFRWKPWPEVGPPPSPLPPPFQTIWGAL